MFSKKLDNYALEVAPFHDFCNFAGRYHAVDDLLSCGVTDNKGAFVLTGALGEIAFTIYVPLGGIT